MYKIPLLFILLALGLLILGLVSYWMEDQSSNSFWALIIGAIGLISSQLFFYFEIQKKLKKKL
jgi:CHASE3 domain sensor protein